MSRAHGPNSGRRRQIKRHLAARDGARCFYCGQPFAALIEASIDHLVPQSRIPGWVSANLVLACTPCNAAKADQLPQVFLRPSGYRPGLVPTPTRRVREHVTALTARTSSGTVSSPVPRTVSAPVRHRARPGVRLLAGLVPVLVSAVLITVHSS